MKSIKKYILKRLGILSLQEQFKDIQNEVQDLKKSLNDMESHIDDVEKRFEAYIDPYWDAREIVRRIKLLQHNRDEMKQKIQNLEKMVFLHSRELNKSNRTPRIIVSLTSFPARIESVGAVIDQMLLQTVKADEVILWLSKEQFPNREKELPERLLEYKKYGVKIEWCDGDIKAYKKFLPALKKYPDDLIIIIDDDLVYPIDLVEKLYEAHKRFPNAIIASRVHEIGIGQDGKIVSYRNWKKQIGYDTYKVRDDWFFTGGAGTLLPPHIFGKEIFNEKIIQELCPWADDIWLNINAAMNRVSIVNTASNNKLARIEETQAVCLQDINLKKNDMQLRNLVTYYKEKLAGTIYEKM